MSAGDALFTITSVVVVCCAVVSALSCAWPAEPLRSATRPTR